LFLPIANAEGLATLERRCIEIVSNRYQEVPIDVPFDDWLGNQQGPGINNAISQSHLWCVQHTGNYQPHNPQIYNDALLLLGNSVADL
jgi:hypothetical protein